MRKLKLFTAAIMPMMLISAAGTGSIAAVVDHFSDQLLKNPKIVNANPERIEIR